MMREVMNGDKDVLGVDGCHGQTRLPVHRGLRKTKASYRLPVALDIRGVTERQVRRAHETDGRHVFIGFHEPGAAPRDNAVRRRNPIQLPQATIATTNGQRDVGGELPTGTDGSVQSIAPCDRDNGAFPADVFSVLTNGSVMLVFHCQRGWTRLAVFGTRVIHT